MGKYERGDANGGRNIDRLDEPWEAIAARLPAGWQPDFVALYLPYTRIPAGLWAAPGPIVGLAADWSLLWHAYRSQLRRCDLVLTDTVGVALPEMVNVVLATAVV